MCFFYSLEMCDQEKDGEKIRNAGVNRCYIMILPLHVDSYIHTYTHSSLVPFPGELPVKTPRNTRTMERGKNVTHASAMGTIASP